MLKKTLFIIFLLMEIMAFGQTENDTVHVKIEPFKFNNIPDIIDGGTCYFASSIDDCRDGEYIFVNDFASYGCIKINGTVQLLELSMYNLKDEMYIYIYPGTDVVVEIQVKGILEKEDGMYSVVKFIVQTKSDSFEKTLFGRCED